MSLRGFLSSDKGTASAEFALVLPMLVVLMFGGFEAGYFIWMQHKLTEAVRDGARFASRMNINDFCNGATLKSDATYTTDITNIKLLTRTGQLASTSAPAKVPGWADGQVTVTVTCEGFVSTGIYNDLGNAGPVVTVSATNVAYPSLFHGLGVLKSTINLNATSNAAVIGV
ncbi:TadE/TadG family type IV pilus assembly protein [Novosphingobium sp.]|uniref:TadE/TadG family type IV pilus assembly protein n=1 Tax=Novosphingobium sp. TaxID=1874826 RepID=UPI002FDA43A7